MGNLDPWPPWAVMQALAETDDRAAVPGDGGDGGVAADHDHADHDHAGATDDWGARWRLEEPVSLGQLLTGLLWPLALFLGLVVYALLATH